MSITRVLSVPGHSTFADLKRCQASLYAFVP